MSLMQPLKWQGQLPTTPREIVGFPGYRVWADSTVDSCWLSVNGGRRFLSEVWTAIKADKDKRGRKRVTLRRGDEMVKVRLSRLVLTTFVCVCPDGMEACHENGDETHDTLDNLRWDTHSANLLDKRKHGTMTNGEKHIRAKLTAAAVLKIRRLGKPLKRHADRYGVSESLVSMVLKRRIWQHV